MKRKMKKYPMAEQSNGVFDIRLGAYECNCSVGHATVCSQEYIHSYFFFESPKSGT